MSETLRGAPEQLRHRETAEIAGERLKSLEKSAEQFDESSQERAVEHARKQAELEAVFAEEQGRERRSGGEPGDPTPTVATKNKKKEEYEKTMTSVRSQLSRPSRTFSKFIHTPAVERTSDALGSTIARPNAVLAGSIAAFLAVGVTYIIAWYIGFRLSGFETIAAFTIGWIIGIVIDLIRVSLRR